MLGHNRKVTVVGAGTVGTTFAYACLLRASCDEILLVDTDESKRDAQAKDLAHGSAFFPPASVGVGEAADARGSQVIAVAAGAKVRKGETRLDLAERNVKLLRKVLPPLIDAAPDATLLLISNPVDVLTFAARELTGLPSTRVVGSGTVLDSARFRQLLARHLAVAPADVNAYVVGEHGDSQVPLWSTVTVAGLPLDAWPAAPDGPTRRTIAEETRTAAKSVVAGKGVTNFAVGICCARIVEALYDDLPSVLPVSAVVDADDGFPTLEGVALSLPRPVSRLHVGRPLPVPMSDAERQALDESARALREAQTRAMSLGS